MAKRLKKNNKKGESILLTMYNNKMLVTKVDDCLDRETPYREIIDMCKNYGGIDISAATLSRYASLRKSAIASGEDLGKLLSSSQRKALSRAKSKEVASAVLPEKIGLTQKDKAELAKTDSPIDADVFPYVNTNDFLSLAIKRSYETLANSQAVSLKDGIAAAKLQAQITNNAYNGMAVQGFQELRLQMTAITNALSEVLMTYVPEDKQEEASKMMEEREKEIINNMEVTEQGRQLLRAARDGGIDV